MDRLDASELGRRLARNAEEVCRHYLSAGRREGAYWLVGDARNTPGRSMFVRLKETTRGPAGKWVDYVAPRVMLRACEWAQFHGRLPVFAQHNFSALGDVT